MVIKVDFDLTMTILAHNLYRILALDLERYSNFTDERIYAKFIANNGAIQVKGETINIELKKKRDLPQVIDMMKNSEGIKYHWLNNAELNFIPSSTS